MTPPRGHPASPAARPRQHRAFALALLALVAASVVGCVPKRIGGSETADQVINELRTENDKLQTQVAQLQKNIGLRMDQIAALDKQLHGAQPMPGVEAPRLATFKFDRYTSAINTRHGKADDTIRLYLQTLDQEGRFIPVAGKAIAQAVAINPGQQPTILAQKSFDPAALDQAYRTGLTGTHYTLDLPLPSPLPKGVTQATVKVILTDAATGVDFSQETVLPISSTP